MNEIELATLAGFFAGEGSITVTNSTVPVVYAALGNTERFWVEKFHKYFGGSFYVEQPKYAGAKHIFRWRVCGKQAANFMRQIQPYLIGEKAEQLKIALQLQTLKEQAPYAPKTHRYVDNAVLEMSKMRNSMRAVRCAAAETNRRDASTWRSDSPTLEAIPVS